MILEFRPNWPFIFKYNPETGLQIRYDRTLERVTLPDGGPGVVHHVKPDGTLAVRPIDLIRGTYLPNRSNPTWTSAQRWSIPEEFAIKREHLSQ